MEDSITAVNTLLTGELAKLYGFRLGLPDAILDGVTLPSESSLEFPVNISYTMLATPFSYEFQEVNFTVTTTNATVATGEVVNGASGPKLIINAGAFPLGDSLLYSANITISASRSVGPIEAQAEASHLPITVSTTSPGEEWGTGADMPSGRFEHEAAVAGGKLYVFTGYPKMGSIDEYNPATNTWASKSAMPAGQEDRNVAAASLGGKIYVAGGKHRNDLRVYDPDTDSWEIKSQLPAGREAAGGVALGGKFYVVGGKSGSTAESTVQCYDPATNSWSTKANMPTARFFASTGAVGGKIYVVGGEVAGGVTNKVEVYDPVNDSWESLGNFPWSFNRGAAASAMGKLYVAGGWNGASHSAGVWEYDPGTDTWTSKAHMPNTRNDLAMAGSDYQLFVTGGRQGMGSRGLSQLFISPVL